MKSTIFFGIALSSLEKIVDKDKSVCLFGGFSEDKRLSMKIYIDYIYANIRENRTLGAGLTVEKIIPKIPLVVSWLFKISSGLGIRIARYVYYPLYSFFNKGKINHIVDQSYGHLVFFLGSKNTVVSVHDLIPLLAWNKAIPMLQYPHNPVLFKLAIIGIKRARKIIAVSESTKKDLIEHCKIDKDKIVVIHNGIDPCFKPIVCKNVRNIRIKMSLPVDRKLVLISGIQSYKNHITSFKVVDLLKDRYHLNVHVVWLGGDDCSLASIKGEDYLDKGNVTFVNNISLDGLVELYNAVDCLLFPSLYEGFGWPPIEAMACGLPVVASDCSSLPEVVGDAGFCESPTQELLLADKVNKMITDQDIRNEYIRRGVENANNFSWESSVEKIENIYKEVASEICTTL